MIPSLNDHPPPIEDLSPQPVRFRLCDARLPPPHELMALLLSDHVMTGEVVGRSRGVGEDSCVVVRIAGLDQMVVVSEQNLLPDC